MARQCGARHGAARSGTAKSGLVRQGRALSGALFALVRRLMRDRAALFAVVVVK